MIKKKLLTLSLVLFMFTGVAIAQNNIMEDDTGPKKCHENTSSSSSNKDTLEKIMPKITDILKSLPYEVAGTAFIEPKYNPKKGFVDITYPKNTWITENKPVFKWKPVEGAKGYTIKVYYPLGEIFTHYVNDPNKTELDFSDPTIEFNEQFMDFKDGVMRNKFYYMTVKAEDVSPFPCPYGYFYVMTEEEIKTFKTQTEAFKKEIKDLDGIDKDLNMAAFYESVGHYAKAEPFYINALTRVNNYEEKKRVELSLANLYIKSDRLKAGVDIQRKYAEKEGIKVPSENYDDKTKTTAKR